MDSLLGEIVILWMLYFILIEKIYTESSVSRYYRFMVVQMFLPTQNPQLWYIQCCV